MQFKKATKSQSKLRAALFGPSGAGKTYTALRIATGMGGAIAVIDTERGSASKYADRFAFDVLDLEDKGIDTYVSAIQAASGYDVLIIDSLTHGWQELLQEVDQIAKTRFKGNTWSAWSEGTPKQRALVDAMLGFKGHVLATMRSKTEWSIEQSGQKSKPVRVGLAPEQGKGIEYEFDLLLELSVEHFASVIKDRTGKFQDQIIDKPGEEFGQALTAWLQDGAPPPSPLASDAEARRLVAAAMKGRSFDQNHMIEVSQAWLAELDLPNFNATSAAQREEFLAAIRAGEWDRPAIPTPKPSEDSKELFTAGAKGGAMKTE